jgi:sulfoxide reductase heme-binding subunit YedZ
MSRKTVQRVALGIHVGAWTPLAALAWMAWQGHLGPVPVAVVTRLLGRYALTLLLLSLVPTAVRIVFGVTPAARFRRPLGLYAFFYALLHVLAFVWLDYRLALDLLIVAVFQSRRELVGLAAFAILTVLAVTSVPGLAKRLGRRWKRIHRSVYPAAFFVVLHAIWNYKELRSWPLFAGAALLLLLIVRIPPVTGLLRRWRRSEEKGSR